MRVIGTRRIILRGRGAAESQDRKRRNNELSHYVFPHNGFTVVIASEAKQSTERH